MCAKQTIRQYVMDKFSMSVEVSVIASGFF